MRGLSAAKILRTTICIPYRAGFVGTLSDSPGGVSSPEAMKDLHAKAMRYEASRRLRASGEWETRANAIPSPWRRPVSPSPFPRQGLRTVAASSFRSPPIQKAISPVPRVVSVFQSRRSPTRLRVGICWQHAPDESLEEFADDSRLRIDAVPASEAKGLGWARSRAQLLYDGEEFNLPNRRPYPLY